MCSVALPFWFDSTHIAQVRHYVDFIFGWHCMPGTQYAEPFRMKCGDFPEDKVELTLSLSNTDLTFFVFFSFSFPFSRLAMPC